MRDRKEIEDRIDMLKEAVESIEDDGREWSDDWFELKRVIKELEWILEPAKEALSNSFEYLKWRW